MPTKKSSPVNPSPSRVAPAQSRWVRWVLVILLLTLVGVFLVNKGGILAAVVNGKPIFRWQLNKILVNRYGKQTLEGMISEALIAQEAKKEGIVISQEDVDSKVKAVVKGLGQNVSLDDVLKFQGMTRADFESQIRLQLTVERLLGKSITITEGDVDAYIATNSATLTATEPAVLREEARKAILNTKINEKLQPWFLDLEQKAKILRFL